MKQMNLSRGVGWIPIASAVYVAAAVALVQMPDQVRPDLVVWSALLAFSVYIFDRVKWWDRALDPADADADPPRATWERHHAVRLRVVAAVAAVAVVAWGLAISPWLAAVATGAQFGGALYGSVPRRVRLKDHFLVKNLAVGGSVAALAGVTTLVSSGATPDRRWCGVLACLALQVTADAIASDIDDAASDRHHGTETVAGRLGARRAWSTFVALGLVAAAGLLALAMTVPGVLLLASTVALGWYRPAPARVWIDLRLVAVVWAAAVVFGHGDPGILRAVSL